MHTALMVLTSYEANDTVAKLAEEPIGGVAEAAEETRSYNRRKDEKPSSHDHFSGTWLSSGTPSGNWTLGVPCVAL